ncbi:hypothetical protein SDC9_152172 [bioreactor metagenome]|uniref:Uncharacterized protein n=1 Tax=bioreactor metagenome TaxID=1076179 RepID=A0A645EWT9_9ZZZZ
MSFVLSSNWIRLVLKLSISVLFGFTFKKALFSAFLGFNLFIFIYSMSFFQSVYLTFSIRFSVRALAKNGSFGFFSVGLCVGKNQMCHLCGGLSTMNANGLWYGVVREYEAISYQFTPTFFTSCKRSQTFETRMHYTMCVRPA